MPGALLPPFAEPTGPKLPLRDLIDSFVGGTQTGFSDEAHIETNQLLLERMISAVIRLSTDSVLVRRDLPPGARDHNEVVESQLQKSGLTVVERDARLGDIAAIQTIGIRGSSWDLWGRDPGGAQRDLERVVIGDDAEVPMSEMPTADGAGGMTLEELFDDNDEDRP